MWASFGQVLYCAPKTLSVLIYSAFRASYIMLALNGRKIKREDRLAISVYLITSISRKWESDNSLLLTIFHARFLLLLLSRVIDRRYRANIFILSQAYI